MHTWKRRRVGGRVEKEEKKDRERRVRGKVRGRERVRAEGEGEGRRGVEGGGGQPDTGGQDYNLLSSIVHTRNGGKCTLQWQVHPSSFHSTLPFLTPQELPLTPGERIKSA